MSKTFEYRVDEVPIVRTSYTDDGCYSIKNLSTERVAEVLKEAGKDGWDLVSTYSHPSDQDTIVLFLRRESSEKSS